MPEFNEIWLEICQDIILSIDETQHLYDIIKPCTKLIGNTAEIGVYKGHVSKMIKMMTPYKNHYCYDTFCGIVGSNPELGDFHNDYEYSCTLEDVEKYIDSDYVIYKQGFFPDTFNENQQIFSCVYCDTGTYIGTESSFQSFRNTITIGGKMIFYIGTNCNGVKNAINKILLSDIDDFTISFDSSFCIFQRI
jgi:hypothetical protein